MIIIAKNITNDIELFNDVSISILPGESIDLIEKLVNVSNIIQSNNIIDSISKSRIVINDGINDLDVTSALKYLYTGNLNIVDTSGKLRVHATPRKLGLKTIWFGCGDNPIDPHAVGGGQILKIIHNIGDPVTQSIYVDFNCITNETYIHDARISWIDAKYDEFNSKIVPRVTNIISSTNTNYNLYNGYLIIPASGNGTIDLVDDISIHTSGLVYIPNNDLGESPLAFWNADWDPILKRYTNISPAPNGTGRYNMFSTEVTIAKFIHSFCLLGTNSIQLGSYDSDALGHGMRIKLTTITIGDDHIWGMTGIITGYRKKSI
jgi:hypothetical protein